MSKAVLILDMPSGCIKCPLYDYVPSRCSANDKFQNDIGEDFKPAWCPLKPLPDKKPHTGEILEVFVNTGYNACIDELLGEQGQRSIERDKDRQSLI